ncbi:MAG: hypothetical protein JWR85_3561 [Marmoricola sp.]|nr:hypothetical protein [Marmoricola sp.]
MTRAMADAASLNGDWIEHDGGGCTCQFGREHDGSEFGPCRACEQSDAEEKGSDAAHAAIERASSGWFVARASFPNDRGVWVTHHCVRVGGPFTDFGQALQNEKALRVKAVLAAINDEASPQSIAAATRVVETEADRKAAKALLDKLKLRDHETGTFRDWDVTVAAFAQHRAEHAA